MKSLSTPRTLWFLSIIFPIYLGICQAADRSEMREDKEKLVVLPFSIDGITSDQSRILKQRFEQTLQESGSFELLPEHLFKSSLAAVGLERIDSCTSLPCLAQLGKILNVQKVVHVKGMHAAQRYILQIRVVNVSDAKPLYDESLSYSGEFNSLLADALAEHAKRIDKTYVSTGTPWYYYAAAAIIVGGLIYWAFSTWATSIGSESGDSPSTSSPK
jgi:hypothetical protein